MENIQAIREGDWPAIESSTKPVLVDFWATWCAPCRVLGAAFDRLAEKYGREVHFAKVNVDDLPELAGQFEIRSIPTLLLLKEGKVIERVVGARSYDELARLLEAHVPVPAKVN